MALKPQDLIILFKMIKFAYWKSFYHWYFLSWVTSSNSCSQFLTTPNNFLCITMDISTQPKTALVLTWSHPVELRNCQSSFLCCASVLTTSILIIGSNTPWSLSPENLAPRPPTQRPDWWARHSHWPCVRQPLWRRQSLCPAGGISQPWPWPEDSSSNIPYVIHTSLK